MIVGDEVTIVDDGNMWYGGHGIITGDLIEIDGLFRVMMDDGLEYHFEPWQLESSTKTMLVKSISCKTWKI